VVDFGSKSYLGRFERIVGRELYLEVEHTILIRSLGRTHYGSNPVEEVVGILGSGAAISRRVLREVLPLLLNALLSRHCGRREEKEEGTEVEELLSHTQQ